MNAAADGAPNLGVYASALIVKPSSLGDIVHTLPAVAAIKATFPDLQLRWVANTEWVPLLAGCPLLEEVIPFPRKTMRGLRGPIAFWRWCRELKAARPFGAEVVLDFQGLLRSALIARGRGSRPIVGLSDAREGAPRLYQHTVLVDAGAHAVDRYLTLAGAVGAAVPSAEDVAFPLPTGLRPKGWPDGARPIVIHPTSRGEGKSLPTPMLQVLCDALAPLPVVLVGVTDAPLGIHGAHVTDLMNRTRLDELIWVMREAQFCVSVDSGPMHIAAAVNDATLGLHTWSDPRRVGPHNPRAWVWKSGRIDHRQGFSLEECISASQPGTADMTDIAEFVRQRISAAPL
ncbi:MAG: glycosyltransferase family 9 protein [Verrucomicrobiales bacterium]|nr:glycosyltransferase family 9 protein [Verrucomicrobiales bacterium]MCP5557903.1 glycosyltransferase family 9 protein [Verrucomicrobiaceae bacterium]